jgi:uncharacterized damage-inducible protein DinB
MAAATAPQRACKESPEAIMVTPGFLQTLYTYHAHVNGIVLDTAAALSEEQLDHTPIAAHPSIRATLVHALSAEWVWQSRIQGSSPSAMLDPADFPTLAAIRARWEAETNGLRALIAGLSAADLDRQVRYVRRGTTMTTPLWQILVHVANHGMQHRSELAAMLTILGCSPGELDFIRFVRGELGR